MLFQSPSLRGSGRFGRKRRRAATPSGAFQSPSLRGSGRFRAEAEERARAEAAVSIPFIAGQWSLQRAGHRRKRPGGRFNPLHCGAVVASITAAARAVRTTGFNPLHCGAVVASRRLGNQLEALARKFQSPSLRGSGRFSRPSCCCRSGRGSFNPLHCGAVVASKTGHVVDRKAVEVSIPFIAGQWSLHSVMI